MCTELCPPVEDEMVNREAHAERPKPRTRSSQRRIDRESCAPPQDCADA